MSNPTLEDIQQDEIWFAIKSKTTGFMSVPNKIVSILYKSCAACVDTQSCSNISPTLFVIDYPICSSASSINYLWSTITMVITSVDWI
jgi:hypothetical protein